MACNSDYLSPTERERKLQEAAKLLIFVCEKLSITISPDLRETAKNMYATQDYIPQLCAVIKQMSADQLDAIVYNARDKTSRKLANFWEEHQAADKKRELEEAAAQDKQKLRKQLLSFLTDAELEALGVSRSTKS